MNPTTYREVFHNRRVATVLLLGFSSGLPLALTGGTLQAWMTDAKVDIKTIGIFSLVGLPYTLKFLWSPLMDRFVPPLLGRRRGWIVLTQVALALSLAVMGTLAPDRALPMLAALAVGVAFASASQDIVIDAYRSDLLRTPERGVGAAVSVLGYRLAMLASGALALMAADQMGWRATYGAFALLIAACVVIPLLGPEPDVSTTPPRTLIEAVWEPFCDFFSHSGAPLILVLIVLYKLGDAFAGTLTTRFLLGGIEDTAGLNFTKTEVGAVNKGLGLLATLVGALAGGAWMTRLGLFRALMLFGVLQAVSNLAFMWLAVAGKHYGLMIAAIGFENLAGGMGTAAFVAFLMSLCSARYSATQYALLSALSAMARVFIGPPSGFLVAAYGWPIFFFITFLTALPGLALLGSLRRRIDGLNHEGRA